VIALGGDPRRNASFRDRRERSHRGYAGQLDSGIPVANAFSPPDTEEQAKAARRAKGPGLREVAVEMGNLGKNIAKSHNKSARRVRGGARAAGLYAWQLAGDNAATCNPSSRVKRLRQGRRQIFRGLLQGTIETPAALERLIAPVLDPSSKSSRRLTRHPAARGVRAEKRRTDIPYKVVINEADRARQGLRRHRRPQVRERRARQAVPEMRPQERKA